MEYPYIGKGDLTGAVFLIFSRGEALVLDKGEDTCFGYVRLARENRCKNITREYLANTYGRCESQEHANFICELADKAGFSFCNDYKNIHNHFWFDDSHMEFDEAKEPIKAKAKQITIPMPPKCDEQPAKKVTFTADSIKVFDAQGNEIAKFSEKTSAGLDVAGAKISTAKSKPLNNGDNLMFGGEDNCKEWPSIGDEVLSDGIKWEVAAEYKRMVMLVTDDDCCFKVADKRECGKPKTPEEELRNEIAADLNKMQLVSSIFQAGELMAKYNITKKPQ